MEWMGRWMDGYLDDGWIDVKGSEFEGFYRWGDGKYIERRECFPTQPVGDFPQKTTLGFPTHCLIPHSLGGWQGKQAAWQEQTAAATSPCWQETRAAHLQVPALFKEDSSHPIFEPNKGSCTLALSSEGFKIEGLCLRLRTGEHSLGQDCPM